MESVKILAINPGSTSTKIAVYNGKEPVFIKTIRHKVELIGKFEKITDQFGFRKEIIIEELKAADIQDDNFKAIVGRGGLTKPIESGVYQVNEKMKRDLLNSSFGEHASNLGGLIADDLARSIPGCKAYITNPIVVDEMDDIARISGHPAFQRKSIFHALNQKAVAMEYARSTMKKYDELNLIVAHLGGGITIGAHRKGKVVDVNQGLDGEGPFSPERSGTLPSGDLVRFCLSSGLSESEILKMIQGRGGLVAYLGTNDTYEVEKMVQSGDEKASFIYEAMAYQVSKMIGEMAAVLKGDIDGILITGGIAHDEWFVNKIIERVSKFGEVHVYPGEDEMKALVYNVLRVINGEIKARIYK